MSIRSIIAIPIRAAFRILPQGIPLFLSKIYPPFYHLLPKDIEIVCESYLGKYRMNIGMVYPIEMDMLLDKYEPDVMGTIRKYVRPGMVAFDIGANAGAVSFALADTVGETGRVYSFEPGAVIYERFLKNISLNPSVRSIILPQNLGCAEKPGKLVYLEMAADGRGNALLRPADGTGNNFLRPPTGKWEPHQSHEVEVITLDTFVREKGVDRLDFMKIDVEGMEYEVLLGARETLSRFHPVLCCETLPDMDHVRGTDNFCRIEELLTELGYDLYRVEGSPGEEKATAGNFSLNTLAVPRKG